MDGQTVQLWAEREFAQYDKIGLQHITMTYGVDDAVPQIWIDGKQIPIEIVAKNDGLTVEQFVEWFFGESKSNVFEGVVLHFTSFRYWYGKRWYKAL